MLFLLESSTLFAALDIFSGVHALFHASATRFSLANLLALAVQPMPPRRQTRTGSLLQDARFVQAIGLVATTYPAMARAGNRQPVSEARVCNISLLGTLENRRRRVEPLQCLIPA